MAINFNDITDTATPTTGNFSVGGTLTTTAVYANGLFYASNNQPWVTGGGGGGSSSPITKLQNQLFGGF